MPLSYSRITEVVRLMPCPGGLAPDFRNRSRHRCHSNGGLQSFRLKPLHLVFPSLFFWSFFWRVLFFFSPSVLALSFPADSPCSDLDDLSIRSCSLCCAGGGGHFAQFPFFPFERSLSVPTFTNVLPKVSKHLGFDLRRTPISKPLVAICTCEEFLVCDTHFWHGRTLPCERVTDEFGKTTDDSACPACVQKQPYRTHCYVSVFDNKTHEHFIFECTSFAAKPFEEYIQTVGTLRGCGFSSSRPKCAPNSKVVIATTTANLSRVTLPSAPDLARALSVIWRLPLTALPVVVSAASPPIVKADSKILNRMRNQTDDAGGVVSMAEVLSGSPNRNRRH